MDGVGAWGGGWDWGGVAVRGEIWGGVLVHNVVEIYTLMVLVWFVEVSE